MKRRDLIAAVGGATSHMAPSAERSRYGVNRESSPPPRDPGKISGVVASVQGIAKPGGICLSEDAFRQVKARLTVVVSELGATQLKNQARQSGLDGVGSE